MAKHDVTFSIPERKLGKADIAFKVTRDGTKLGRLKISNGSIVWVPKNQSYGYKISWQYFNDIMKQYGSKEK